MTKRYMDVPPSLHPSVTQWWKKAISLKPRELAKRIWSLVSSLPVDIFFLHRLEKVCARNGKKMLCIILTDRMGDIIAAEPVARHFRTNTEHLVWLVQPRYQDLLRYNPNIDTIQTVSSYTETILLRKIFKNIIWTDLHFDGYQCDRFGIRAHNPNQQGLTSHNYYNFGALTNVFAIIGTGHPVDDKPKIYPDKNLTSLVI
jgi:hypothetical protein